MKKKGKKKAFTLVELLAVIVVLAIILVIAVPRILEVIKESKIGSMTSSVKLIAKTAEQKIAENAALELDDPVTCDKIAQYAEEDYSSCSVSFSGGVATVTLVGKGKFAGLVCSGNKEEATCENEGEKVYTVKRSLTSSSTAWERMDDAVGLVANATKNGSAVTNDFDSIYPWSDIISYNYDTSTGSVTAYYGDANFKFDGSNGEVLTKIPEFYYKRYQDDEYEYISISGTPAEGFTKSNEFSVGRYLSSYDGSKLHSKSGALPEVNRNITTFRTLSQAVGTNFGQMDYHHFILQMLYLVEYADYNSQNVLGNGHTTYRHSSLDKALIAESSTNRIVINSTGGAAFIVGQYIHVGEKLNFTTIARYRKITAIADYSDGNITGKSITFDGSAVNIAVDNVIFSAAQKAGDCDSLGMKSGTINNDGKHGVIYRGIENIFGNIMQCVDGINVNNTGTSIKAYINYNPVTYAVNTITGDYSEIGYDNALTTGYVKTMGYDSNHPFVAFPTSVGGSATTYVSDNYLKNTGLRICHIGGGMDNTTKAGMFYWGCSSSSDGDSPNVGSRLLKY